MPDISDYEYKPGRVWRKIDDKIPHKVPSISKYEVVDEMPIVCPKDNLLKAIRTLGRKGIDLHPLDRID